MPLSPIRYGKPGPTRIRYAFCRCMFYIHLTYVPQREWLVSHGIIKSQEQKTRDKLNALMQTYYYDPKDHVWNTWTDSQLKAWLVENNVITDSARPKTAHMQKLVADNYRNAVNVPWEAWRDSDMRAWLIEHGYLRSDAQVKRDQLVKLMNEKCVFIPREMLRRMTYLLLTRRL